MEALSKPIKFLPWQITKIKDKFGNEKINIRYYRQSAKGMDFTQSQNIYCKPADFENFKIKLRARKKKQ